MSLLIAFPPANALLDIGTSLLQMRSEGVIIGMKVSMNYSKLRDVWTKTKDDKATIEELNGAIDFANKITRNETMMEEFGKKESRLILSDLYQALARIKNTK